MTALRFVGLRGVTPDEGRYDFACSTVRLHSIPDDRRGHEGAVAGSWRDRQILRMMPGQKTFSLGIFRYVQAKKGIKRAPVVERIRGTFDNPREAFERAERRCKELEEGS